MRPIVPLLFLLAPGWLACHGYGAPQPIATRDNRLAGTELLGRWQCPPEDANCDGDPHQVSWLEVDRRDSTLRVVWKRAAIRDSFVGYDSLDRRVHVDLPGDTVAVTFEASLLRVGRDTILEFTGVLPEQALTTVPAIPLHTWVRLHPRRDSVRLDVLDGERLARQVAARPDDFGPVRILRSPPPASRDVIVVALGGRAEVERFVRRAFADPALLVPGAFVLVRVPVAPPPAPRIARR
ncbi:MAG TPA: hypothetical protein VFX50_18755 [Gemmatimonadales bacterium]|nr:hypothetical protein [Gemmatimonadales bacterium]